MSSPTVEAAPSATCSCAHCSAMGRAYSEAYRHECEVRHVLGLPTRMARWAYVEGAMVDGRFVKGVRQVRGDRAADRLRDDVKAAWQRLRDTTAPPAPAGEEPAATSSARSVHVVNDRMPGRGSSLGITHAGDSDPVRGVVSEALAR